MRKVFIPVLFLCLFCFARSLYAQNVPPTPAGSSSEVLLKKEQEKAERKILESPAYEEPSVTEEETSSGIPSSELRFLVTRINLEGDSKIVSSPELKPLYSGLEGREITFRDLDGLRKKIETFYRAKGYLASVYMPPQRLENGEVLMRVLIYKMGDLKIEGNKYSRAWKLRSYWTIPQNEQIRYEVMQKNITAMNQNPDRSVKAYIKAAKEQGTVDIYLKVKDHFPIHGGYSFDNQGVRLTGKLKHGFTARHNNLLGLDDIFLIGTSFSHSFGAIFLQHLIPVNSRGTRFLWGFSHSQVEPLREFKPFGINSTSQNYNIQLRQKVFSTPRFLGDCYLGYDFKEKRSKQLSVTNTWDKLRVLSTGGDFQAADPWGVWQAGQDFSFGLPFRGDGYALTSRGGESSFFKYGFSLNRTQPFFWKTRFSLNLTGQVTPDKLTPEEQIFLGGMDTVRGYPESDYGADNGIVTRIEYQIPTFFFPQSWHFPGSPDPLRKTITLISFFDHGYGNLRRPDENENDNHLLMGAGGGVRIRFRENISAELMWAARLGNEELTEGGGPSQFHFGLNFDA